MAIKLVTRRPKPEGYLQFLYLVKPETQCGDVAEHEASSQGILAAKLDAGDVEKAACPMPNCHQPLPLSEAQRLLPLAKFRRFRRLLLQRYIDSAPNMAW